MFRFAPALMAAAFAARPQLIYAQQQLKISLETESTIDPATRTSFPNMLSIRSTQHRLLGVGVRRVTFLRFHTYAAGIYTKLNDQKTFPSPAALVETSSSLVLRLVPVRNTNGSHLQAAMSRMLQSKQPTLMQEDPSYKEACDQFAATFPKTSVSKGTEMLFVKQGGVLWTYCDGRETGCIDHPVLADTFFSAFVADEPALIPELKQQLEVNLEQ